MAVQAVSAAPPATVACAVVQSLARLGVREAYGVSGGAMAALWHAFSASGIAVCHFRHESGAAFAAAEASHAGQRPVAVFTTTGPGLSNALTGLMAARDVGAKVILVSAFSSSGARGRFAIQETSTRTMPRELHHGGSVFDFAAVIDRPDMLGASLQAVANGFARPGGFVAHLALPTSVQAAPAIPFDLDPPSTPRLLPTPSALAACRQALADGDFAIWLGSGAAGATAEVLELIERTGAAVFCTPRGKGIVPEAHARFVGVTGMGGHESVTDWLGGHPPSRILVLGSRLGEASSSWDPRLATRLGFVHVDLDASVFEAAYPGVPCLGVVADVGSLLRGLLERLPKQPQASPSPSRPPFIAPAESPPGRVRPEALMAAIQREIVDASDAIVLAESGNAFIWTTHFLRFATPGRYRASTGFGAMGHAAAGVVGTALAARRPAVAVVGDGALLMHNEINTAVKYAAPAIWIVLNDARYGMCAQGMQTLGLAADSSFPEVDFVAFARAQGADGVQVKHAAELGAAIRHALAAHRPFVIDVAIDLEARPPAGSRNRALARQLGEANPDVSFPPR